MGAGPDGAAQIRRELRQTSSHVLGVPRFSPYHFLRSLRSFAAIFDFVFPLRLCVFA
jgi:hypothetical protein